ncbi:Arylsulfotransferase-domain-containing protein [Xylaria sp. CBS 124048]|nr:Arylsulfotransferase-domain-containing protein [Xylaria sp. CBS 124048]
MTRLSSVWLLFSAACLQGQTSAYDVFSSAYLYEAGFYGLYPTVNFKSFGLAPPRLNFAQRDEEQCNEGYYLIAQKGKLVSNPGPTIFDSRGELVWADNSFGVVFDFQTQTYKGKPYLTFWASPSGSTHGYGRGTYYMLDSSYQVFRKFEPRGEGLRGDLHEFHITERGTALMTIYNPIPADLTSVGGPKQGWVLDCMVQEIDIETGDLKFQWSAAENVAISDTIRSFAGEDDGTTPQTAFDFFHVNSIDVNAEGNYIISGRHTSTILCVAPKGDTLWTLGGINNDFHDLSDGSATDFAYQHHARIHENNTLSIFDNAASERAGAPSPYSYSRGILVQLDTVNMTAELLHSYHDPQNPKLAVSQGSMQVLDNGHVVLGYGWLPYITEFAVDGSVLCDVEIAPWVSARWGLVTTYRASKTLTWVGQPTSPPSLFLDPPDGAAFASWNGATEVQKWMVQGASWDDLNAHGLDGFVDIDVVAKDAFETCLEVRDDMPQYLRVAAVDKNGKVLGHSLMVDRYVGNIEGGWGLYGIIPLVVILLAVVGAVLVIMRRRGRRALWGNSMRRFDILARIMAVVKDRVVRAKDTVDTGGSRNYQYTAAKEHELESLYHD